MLNEVSCPKCGAKLRSTNDLTGKTVRCSKCQEKFRVASTAPLGVSAGDRPMPTTPNGGSVKPIPVSTPVRSALDAMDDLLVLDPMPVPKAVARPVMAMPVPAPATPNAFAFDDEPSEKPRKKQRTDDGEAPTKKKKKRQDDDEDDTPATSRGTPEKKRLLPILLLVGGVIGFLMLAGGGVAAYFLVIKKPDLAKATSKGTTAPEAPPTKAGAKSTAEGTEQTGTKPTASETLSSKNARPPKGGPNPPAGPVKLPAAPAAALALVAPAGKGKVGIDVVPESIKAFRVSGDANDRKIFIVRNTSTGFMGRGVLDTVDCYAADTGAKVGSCEVKADGAKWPRPFEPSPDGRHALIEGPAGRVSLYSFELNQYVLEGVDPFAGQATRKGPLKGLAWKGNDHFHVFDANGSPDEWSVADKKLTKAGPALPDAADAKVITGVLDSKGESLAVVAGSKYHLVVRGKVAASGDLPDANAVPIALAGSVLADKVAVVANLKDTPQHFVYLVKPAEKEAMPVAIPLPEGIGAVTDIGWQSENTIVVTIEGGAAALFVDVEHEAVVALVKSPAGRTRVFAKVPFITMWYCQPDPTAPGKTLFVNVNLDFDNYRLMADEAKTNRAPAYLVPKDTGLEK